MRKFAFKLESVLTQRKRREEMAQKEFAEALQILKEAEKKIYAKQNEINRGFEVSPIEENKQVDVNRLIENRRYIEHMYIELEELNQDYREKEKVAQHKQHFLMMAAKEREAMSRFKEKKKQAWLKEAMSEEQKMLDEVGLQMSTRGDD